MKAANLVWLIMCEYDFDHIIVGGGITGSSAAYQLSKRNARVLVLSTILILYYTILYYTIPYYTILYYTIL